jgi:hypothetical protein
MVEKYSAFQRVWLANDLDSVRFYSNRSANRFADLRSTFGEASLLSFAYAFEQTIGSEEEI